MYNNEPFDDYIRSILGYPNINNTYTPENNNYNSYYNYSAKNTVDTNNNQEIEECYPEIYRIIYPMIQNRCKRITEPLTKDLIENITNEIYSSIEVTNEINIDNVNIASQNEVNNSNNTSNRNSRQENKTKEVKQDVNKENREDRRDNGLRDLIKILIIRELLKRPKPGPRPPFPPNRPPIMPRYNYMDIYEM